MGESWQFRYQIGHRTREAPDDDGQGRLAKSTFDSVSPKSLTVFEVSKIPLSNEPVTHVGVVSKFGLDGGWGATNLCGKHRLHLTTESFGANRRFCCARFNMYTPPCDL